MKILPSVLFLAAHGQDMGDGYTAGEGKPIDDVLRRLKNLKKWGNECAGKLIPDAKNNVLRKIYNFDRNAVRYYNNNNADFQDLDEPEMWLDHLDGDRTISTDNPCECLWRVGRGYMNFYSRGFADSGKPREKAKHMWSQLNKRLEKSYGCDLSQMGYKDPKPTTEAATTTPAPSPNTKCPDGFTKFADDNDRCFKTQCQKTPISFQGAQETCQDLSGQLTMVKSEVQNGQVAKTGPIGGLTDAGVQLKGGIWINGHDHEEGTWTFTDGSPMGYTNWAAGQPNDGNPQITQDCLWMNFLSKGAWDDMNCVNVRSVHCVSCEVPADVLPENYCSDDVACSDGFCNFHFGDHGFCQECDWRDTVEDCNDKFIIVAKGREQCNDVCVPEGCKAGQCNEDCPCSDGFCNFHFDDYGFCQECDWRNTEEDCEDRFIIFEKGQEECKDVCVPEDPCAGDICSADCPCAEGSMCNYDYETSGFCESCDGFDTEKACYDEGFKTKTGTKECLDVCVIPEPCDENNCSADCPCAEGYCNFGVIMGKSGFCSKCDEVYTKLDCVANMMSDEGKQDCLDVCMPQAECSKEWPCSEGYCNFGVIMGKAGFCSSCDEVYTRLDCVANPMMDEGKQDCLDVCEPRGECSEEWPCSEGWCNMENGGNSGRCITCRDQKTKKDCFGHDAWPAARQNCYDACVSPCEREREAALKMDANGRPIMGAFVPMCDANGDYTPEQCHGSTGYCWCVEADGTKIPGTKKRGPANCGGGY